MLAECNYRQRLVFLHLVYGAIVRLESGRSACFVPLKLTQRAISVSLVSGFSWLEFPTEWIFLSSTAIQVL